MTVPTLIPKNKRMPATPRERRKRARQERKARAAEIHKFYLLKRKESDYSRTSLPTWILCCLSGPRKSYNQQPSSKRLSGC